MVYIQQHLCFNDSSIYVLMMIIMPRHDIRMANSNMVMIPHESLQMLNSLRDVCYCSRRQIKLGISVPLLTHQNSTECLGFVLNKFKCRLIGQQSWKEKVSKEVTSPGIIAVSSREPLYLSSRAFESLPCAN